MQPTIKIIIATLIWGSLGIFVKNISLPSTEIAFLRALIAALFFILINFIKTKKTPPKALKDNLLKLIISGAAIGLNWVLLFQAYKYTSISNATLSYYFAPIIVILLSPIILKEKLKTKKIIAVLGAMFGLFIILSHQNSSAGLLLNNFKGITYGLFAALLYASVILLNKYVKGISSFDRTLVQITAAAVVLLPFIIYRNVIHINQLNNIVYILIIGIIHTGLAYLLYFSALKDLKAQNIAVLSYLDPISAVFIGTLILKEPINLWQVIGGILILICAVISEF